MGWLVDPFRDAFMQRALIEVVVLGLACGPLGAWILIYRQSYAAESISHGMLPGLVIAALAGLPLLAGAREACSCRTAVALAGRDERIGADTGVAVAVSGLFGLGALLALSPEAPPRLEELLFGDLLGARPGTWWRPGCWPPPWRSRWRSRTGG
jgi:ABC-type Mn2+/Zn2+ transport system permease subunit